ncbi:MAG: BON domain-containing protein [Burkholderiales bacterium]
MNSGWETRRVWSSVLGSAALGAAAMYVLDPDKGKRRRALVRDKVLSVVTDTRDAFGAAARDATHRIDGLRARARRLLTNAPIADDLQLIERVRSRMGRLVSHPHALQVGANNGRVTLSGPVRRHEAQRLLDAIRTVWGVSEVEDRLVAHDSAESISSLQSGGEEPDARSAFRHEQWAPAIRVAAMLGGTMLSLWGLRQRSLAGCALAGAGVALTLRGATNRPLSRLAGLPCGAHARSVSSAINVPLPSESVDDPIASTTARESA